MKNNDKSEISKESTTTTNNQTSENEINTNQKLMLASSNYIIQDFNNPNSGIRSRKYYTKK